MTVVSEKQTQSLHFSQLLLSSKSWVLAQQNIMKFLMKICIDCVDTLIYPTHKARKAMFFVLSFS